MIYFLFLAYFANDETGNIHVYEYKHAEFESHQTQHLHSMLLGAFSPLELDEEWFTDWSHRLNYLLRRCHFYRVHLDEFVAGRIIGRRHAAMSSSQVRTLLHPDRRCGHAFRLVSSHPSNPGGVVLEYVSF